MHIGISNRTDASGSVIWKWPLTLVKDQISRADVVFSREAWRFSDLVTSCGSSTALKIHLSVMQQIPVILMHASVAISRFHRD
eukprot:229394-Amphidinium_carterae.1